MRDLCPAKEFGQQLLQPVDGNGKTNSHRTLNWAFNGCIYSDDLTRSIEQRTSAVARIQCSVCLYQPVHDVSCLCRHGPIQTADNSRADARSKLKRIANCNDQV